MTQEQALAAYQAMYPAKADKLAVERERSIGGGIGHPNTFNLWDRSGSKLGLITSHQSWEHVLSIAKSKDEDLWGKDDSPIEEEIAA